MSAPRRRRARAGRWLAGLAAALITLAIGATGALDGLEHGSLDARMDQRGTQRTDELAVVAIDEQTLSTVNGTWPMRRRLHAQMIDRLRTAGARQIVYDVQFTEPSEHEADDLALLDAVSRAPGTILATGESDAQGRTRVLGGDQQLASIGAEAAGSTFPSERGGVVRHYSPQNAHLQTLATATAAAVGHPPTTAGLAPDGTALIDYRGPAGTIPTYSFVDVLRGRVPAAKLRGKIVVVGATAPVLQDIHPTSAPGDRMLAGPEIQANAIWTALHDNPLRALPDWATAVIAILLALGGTALVVALGPLRGPIGVIALGAAYIALAVVLFHRDAVVPVAEPLLALLAAGASAAAVAVATDVALRNRLTRYNARLEAEVEARTAELVSSQLEVVLRLARAAELRDDDTGEHIDRMSGLCEQVALELGWDAPEAEALRHASALHDIGKIGVPDSILLKPGRLTKEEFDVMKRHVVDGAELLTGSVAPVLQLAEVVSRAHHERWDGTGYPAGIAGADIPLPGRIAAVCDVFDALTHERPYKHAWTIAEACAEVARCRGSHFDPQVADALLAVIARDYGVVVPTEDDAAEPVSSWPAEAARTAA